MTAVRDGDLAKLGLLFERYHAKLFDFLSRMTGDRTAAEDLVQDIFVRILKYRATYRDGGSGGQQQRVAVARAVAGEPAILLADEPTGNLDSRSGEAVMGLLRELHQSGATICMVTHDPRYARHADRHIHLFDGRVVEEPMERTATE